MSYTRYVRVKYGKLPGKLQCRIRYGETRERVTRCVIYVRVKYGKLPGNLQSMYDKIWEERVTRCVIYIC